MSKMSKLYSFSYRFIMLLTLFFTGILFLCNFFSTAYASDMEAQIVLFKQDSVLLNLLGILLFVIVFLLIWYFSSKRPILAKKILFTLTAFWFLGMGAILILFSKSGPTADAYSVYQIASYLAEGNTSVVHPTDSYLSYYPQQVGLVAFYEILIRIWNLIGIDYPAYHFIKVIYVLLSVVILFFQYKTVHLLFKNDRTDCIFLLIMGCNIPLIMYTSFVYGELPSYAALSIGIYYFFRMLFELDTKNKLPHFFLGSTFFFTVSVMLRKNSLIFIIALVLVSLFTWMHNRKHILIGFALLNIICSVSILPLIQKGYELRAQNTLRTGVPAMSYFAMGMQEAARGKGWYNGFNFYTYADNNMDTALTNELSWESIHERLSYFKEHPDYAVKFYAEKFLSQWTDGTYASRQATYSTFGGRRDFFKEIYDGKYSGYFVSYCNAFQNIICLGAMLFCLGMFRRKKARKQAELPLYLGLITIFGGFLFHMIWEANSRYIFPYGMMLVPYAAVGMEALSAKLFNRLRKH